MKHPAYTSEQRQREQLLEIGEMLRQARQNQGKALREMAQVTLIRQPLLIAIETADLSELPEPVYVRGLIRRYADALDLDGETLSSQYFSRPNLNHSRGRGLRLPVAQLRPLHLYSVYVLLLMASVSGLSYFLKQTAPDIAAPPILDPEAVEQLMPQQAPATKPPVVTTAVEEELSAPTSDSPIVVNVEMVQQSWMRIVVDGTTQFEGILQQGDARSWSAEESLTIRAGNAGGVLVSYNQGESKTMGEPGRVVEQTFRQGEAISLNTETAANIQ